MKDLYLPLHLAAVVMALTVPSVLAATPPWLDSGTQELFPEVVALRRDFHFPLHRNQKRVRVGRDGTAPIAELTGAKRRWTPLP